MLSESAESGAGYRVCVRTSMHRIRSDKGKLHLDVVCVYGCKRTSKLYSCFATRGASHHNIALTARSRGLVASLQFFGRYQFSGYHEIIRCVPVASRTLPQAAMPVPDCVPKVLNEQALSANDGAPIQGHVSSPITHVMPAMRPPRGVRSPTTVAIKPFLLFYDAPSSPQDLCTPTLPIVSLPIVFLRLYPVFAKAQRAVK